jgi:chitinase
MTGPSGAGAIAAPDGPTERLSFVRLLIVLVIVGGLVVAGVVWTRDALAGDEPVADSWSVPYVDVTATPTYQFQDPQSNPSKDVALAFVVADDTDPCRPSWGTYYTLDEASEQLELDRRITQLRSAGGDVMISFGGQANEELAVACTDQDDLEAAYREVIERYDAEVIDLDIEGPAVTDTGSIERRVQAIAAIQEERAQQGETLDVWLTLPVTPSGLTDSGQALVEANVSGGVELLGVNIMTMNYDEQNPTSDMLGASKRAITASADQIGSIYAEHGTELDTAARYAHIGATPMIGQNDVDGEVFTLDDASGLAQFAIEKGLGRVSIWSLNRDHACGNTFSDVVVHSNTCSGVPQAPLAFSDVFSNLPGRSPVAGEVDAIVVPDRQTTPDDPATSPFPIWRATAQYPEGYKVVWKGLVYEAKWYNQGADPSTTTANPWDTPWALLGPVGPSDQPATLTTVAPGIYPTWDPDVLYQRGTRIDFGGLPYEARWAVQGEAPSTQFPVGPDEPWAPLFADPGAPTTSG